MQSTSSQSSEILAYLKGGNTITPLEALNKFGCLRLAARISDLKKGHPISGRMVTRNGKTFKEYYLDN